MSVGTIDYDVAGWCVIMSKDVQIDALPPALLVEVEGVARCRSLVRVSVVGDDLGGCKSKARIKKAPRDGALEEEADECVVVLVAVVLVV